MPTITQRIDRARKFAKFYETQQKKIINRRRYSVLEQCAYFILIVIIDIIVYFNLDIVTFLGFVGVESAGIAVEREHLINAFKDYRKDIKLLIDSKDFLSLLISTINNDVNKLEKVEKIIERIMTTLGFDEKYWDSFLATLDDVID